MEEGSTPHRAGGPTASLVFSGLLGRSGPDLQDSCYLLLAEPLPLFSFPILFCYHHPGAKDGEDAP